MNFIEQFIERLPSTAQLRVFGLMKIPLLFIISPKVIKINSTECQLKVPLNYITKNHWGSMYFGALSIGADSCGGLLALQLIQKDKNHKIGLLFKSFRADFHKRAEGDVIFRCEAGAQIQNMIDRVIAQKERITEDIKIMAYVEGNPEEPIATLILGLSLKIS